MAWCRSARNVWLHRGARLLLIAFLNTPLVVAADPVKTSISVDISGGYARLVFNMADDVEAAARASGNVLIVTFKRPIDVSVDRLAGQAAGYISAARRDPDGKAIRVALAQKLTVNAMTAGEK